jgi:hypothetical protein
VRVRAWILYSIARVLVFAIPFGVLYAIGLDWWIAALIAAAIGFCVSYIFLRGLREGVTEQLAAGKQERLTPKDDEEAEDGPAAPKR